MAVVGRSVAERATIPIREATERRGATIFSPTEERLRVFIEKLSEALTREVEVEVRPGDSWAAYPDRKPPMITFRLADVATMGDLILSVTAHEIAHLLYTRVPIRWSFDVSRKPRAAHLLLNAVEDSRIERVFSEAFPGARSLFDRKQEQIYDLKVQRGFSELPIKWRFVLNIDRVLHGLEPWGDGRDLDAIEKALPACIDGLWEETTQGCADRLEKPYRILLWLMSREVDETSAPPDPSLPPLLVPPELMGLPSDYESNAPQDDVDEASQRSGSATPHGFELGADEDDHETGGTDSTPGKRQKADGTGQGEGAEGAGGGDGAGGDEQGGSETTGNEGSGGASDDEPDLSAAEVTKPTNIIEEMVNEERAAGSTNKTIDILSYRQRQRAKEAKEIERKIQQEQSTFWDELNRVFGSESRSKEFRARMSSNRTRYLADRTALELEIRTLRAYARNVLRDNATRRFAGNHTSGRKIKTQRLYRMPLNDPRLFERRELVGGKSYDIVLVVDQSSSMGGYGKQLLAYQASLVFLEAFESLIGTSAIGFSDIGWSDPAPHLVSRYGRRYARMYRQSIQHRTYKGLDEDVRRRFVTVPELVRSFGSTPMDVGIGAACDELRGSDADVRAIVLITDGQPNDHDAALRAFHRAKRLGIETYGLHIGGRSSVVDARYLDSGFAFLLKACDHAVECKGSAMIPQAFYRLLRGVVRNRRAVVA